MSEIEECCICEDPTGRAGQADDSIYREKKNGEQVGPLCENCLDDLESRGELKSQEEIMTIYNTNQCIHGSLERKCEICERDVEIQELNSEIASLKAELAKVQGDFDACEQEVSKVYLHITDGKFSKMNTMAEYVIEAAEECIGVAYTTGDARILGGIKAELEDIRNATQGALDETCGAEKHCTCVPLLREEVKRWKAKARELLVEICEKEGTTDDSLRGEKPATPPDNTL